jgi:hypothetical protein
MKYLTNLLTILTCIASSVSCSNKMSTDVMQDKKDSVITDTTQLRVKINNEDTTYQTTKLPLDSIDFRNMTYYISDSAFALKDGIYDHSKNWEDCRTLRIISEMGVRTPGLNDYDVKIVELFFIENACIGACTPRNYILAFRRKSDKLILTGKLEYHFDRPSSWSGDGPMVIYAFNSVKIDNGPLKIWTDLCVLSFNDGNIDIDNRIKIGEKTIK